MEIPQENKIRIDILFSMKVLFQRNICTSMQIAAIFTIVKVLKHQGLSTDEWIKTMQCVCVYIFIYTHHGILFGLKKKSCHFNNVDEPGENYDKLRCQTEKDQYCVCYHLYVESDKAKSNS